MSDDPGMGELARKIEDFRRDVRDDFAQIGNQLAQFVLREVYLADKAALEARLARMEREQEASRSAVRNAVFGAIGSIVATIVVGIIMAVAVKGGR